MKNKSFWIFVLLSLIGMHTVKAQVKASGTKVFMSSNPKVDKELNNEEVLEVNLAHIVALTKSPFVGKIEKSAGGAVRLEVFLYDVSKSDGLGTMIYGVEKVEGKNTDNWAVTYKSETTINGNFTIVSDVMSNHTNRLLAISEAKGGCLEGKSKYTENFAHCLTDLPREANHNHKVVIRATITNTELDSFAIPSMGTFQAEEVFKKARFAQVNGDVSIASHRGFWLSHDAPENTYAAFKAALDAKFDLIEMDLWETKDDSLIVFHDVGLSKRTDSTGPVKHYLKDSQKYEGHKLVDIHYLPIKNRFDELIAHDDTRLRTLRETLDKLISYGLKDKEVFLNLDRSANDMAFFKNVYKAFKEKRLLNKAIFKGKWFPVPDESPVKVEKQPTVANLRQAFREMYPNASPTEIDNHIRLIYFTPIFIDNKKDVINKVTNDSTYAERVKEHIDGFINAGFADGFELNFKAYPSTNPSPSGAFTYIADNEEFKGNEDIYLLKKFKVLGNRTFVDYVKGQNFPVGMFASVPEVCAIPDYKVENGNIGRDKTKLLSGLVKERYAGLFEPQIKDQVLYDYRGNWDFYIGAGADYVINDRPDALLMYLKAIGRHK